MRFMPTGAQRNDSRNEKNKQSLAPHIAVPTWYQVARDMFSSFIPRPCTSIPLLLGEAVCNALTRQQISEKITTAIRNLKHSKHNTHDKERKQRKQTCKSDARKLITGPLSRRTESKMGIVFTNRKRWGICFNLLAASDQQNHFGQLAYAVMPP